jgi:hypothetical protein
MGQAKIKRGNHNNLLKNYPFCIYCGGTTPADGVDHFPAIVIFDGRKRPKGWEFPACDVCNTGAKHVDLVAAMVSRLYPELKTDLQRTELQKIRTAIANNIPGLINEMKLSSEVQKTAITNLKSNFDVGLIRIGPIQQKYLHIFCLKFALAAHFQATKQIVPEGGIVIGKFMTNYESLEEGDLLSKVKSLFPQFGTLQQGYKNVADQFLFASGFSQDKKQSISVARFRQSFEIYGSAGCNRTDFSKIILDFPDSVCSPAELKSLIKSL